MCNCADIVGLEALEDLPTRAYYTHEAIEAADKEAIRSGADAGNLVALEEELCLFVAGLYLRDVEEVEGFPLTRYIPVSLLLLAALPWPEATYRCRHGIDRNQ